ncbi:methicillin resistance protein, partial [Candidatus Saccharibacteria bacterium]|nr:methicillin resistance protein [Candidatus Saccharibacteria bacterium]
MYSHFLQSSAWKTFNESEGKTCFSVEKPNFSFLAVLEQTKLGNYLFLPYGPSLSKTAPLPALSEALSELK